MAWKDVCVRGKFAGGKVRQDDVNKGDPASAHNAGAPSPGILIFIEEVVRNPPPWQWPQKPSDFPSASCRIDTWPGMGNADVHYEGRAADVFLDYTDSDGKRWGDWLFDWCVDNCKIYQIQGVIFGNRQWFSETNRGVVFARDDGKKHYNHVHIELNGDGAATGQPA
jgi:hypothetical protein